MEHHLSRYLIDHVQSTLPQILGPLEEALRLEGNGDLAAIDVVVDDFKCYAVYVASADDEIAEREAAVLSDLCTALKGEKDGAMVFQIIMKQMRASVEDAYRGTSPLPETVRLLVGLDAARGTSHAAVARDLFYKFANAIVKADGKVTDDEDEVLGRLRRALYGK